MKTWGIILIAAWFLFMGSKTILETILNREYFRFSVAVVGLTLLIYALSQKLKKSDQLADNNF